MYASGAGRPCTPRPVAWWQIVNFLLIYIGYGRTGSDPAVHSTSSVKTYNLKWYQRDQQRRHSTKNREAKGTPPSHCSTEQLIQNSSKVNKKYIYIYYTHTHPYILKSPIRNEIHGTIIVQTPAVFVVFFYIFYTIPIHLINIFFFVTNSKRNKLYLLLWPRFVLFVHFTAGFHCIGITPHVMTSICGVETWVYLTSKSPKIWCWTNLCYIWFAWTKGLFTIVRN